MKKIVIQFTFILFSCTFVTKAQENIYTTKDAKVSFYSSAPLENIEATSTNGTSAINATTGDILFKVRITSFQFKKKLMQEHFNENYMESGKYPMAEFKGKIDDILKLQKNGTYSLNVVGKLKIHGIEKAYSTKITLVKANNTLIGTCNFDIKLEDHKIKIPTVVWKNIAEIINVKIKANYRQ